MLWLDPATSLIWLGDTTVSRSLKGSYAHLY
jgi:hypothetical protein